MVLKWNLDAADSDEHRHKLQRTSSMDLMGTPVTRVNSLPPIEGTKHLDNINDSPDSTGVSSESLAVDENKNNVTDTNVTKIQEDTDSGCVITPEKRSFSLEEELQETRRLASGFVSAILASATADFIKLQYEDNHRLHKGVTLQQVGSEAFSLYPRCC